jgi:Putative zinc-finger
MNHTEALQTFAAEKYLLNELSGAQRDEFEEHFFECQECAMDVRAGAAFIAQARTELRPAPQDSTAVKRRSFFTFFNLPLAGVLVAAMAAVVVYQNVVTLPRLRSEVATANAPAVLPATPPIGSASRGTEMPSAVLSHGQALFLNVDVPTDDRFSSYELAFYTPGGSRLDAIGVSPDQAKNTLLVRLPAHEIESGVYTLAVEGTQGGGKPAVKLAQYRFRVLNGN